MTFPCIIEPIAHYQQDEDHEDSDHLHDMMERIDPYLLEKSIAPGYFHKRPEDNDDGISHAQTSAPAADAQLAFEHQCRSYQADHGDDVGHRVMIAQKHGVVAEHQQ